MFNCVQKYPPKTRILPKITPVPNSQVQMFDGAPISGHLPHYGWIKLSRSRPFFSIQIAKGGPLFNLTCYVGKKFIQNAVRPSARCIMWPWNVKSDSGRGCKWQLRLLTPLRNSHFWVCSDRFRLWLLPPPRA